MKIYVIFLFRLDLVNKKGLTVTFTKSSLGCTRQFGQNVNLFFSHTDRIEGTKIDIWQDHRNKGNFTLFELFFWNLYYIIKCPKVYNKYQKSKLKALINRAICIVLLCHGGIKLIYALRLQNNSDLKVNQKWTKRKLKHWSMVKILKW